MYRIVGCGLVVAALALLGARVVPAPLETGRSFSLVVLLGAALGRSLVGRFAG